MYRFFSWYCHYCYWNWEVVGNHCDSLSRDGMMWLVLVLLLLMSSSSALLVPFLWLWLVKNLVSYQNRRFHHRNTHIRSPCQIAYQTTPMPALQIMMMPNSVYIECIGMIHQNGQCLWLALKMTQKLCFSIYPCTKRRWWRWLMKKKICRPKMMRMEEKKNKFVRVYTKKNLNEKKINKHL